MLKNHMHLLIVVSVHKPVSHSLFFMHLQVAAGLLGKMSSLLVVVGQLMAYHLLLMWQARHHQATATNVVNQVTGQETVPTNQPLLAGETMAAAEEGEVLGPMGVVLGVMGVEVGALVLGTSLVMSAMFVSSQVTGAVNAQTSRTGRGVEVTGVAEEVNLGAVMVAVVVRSQAPVTSVDRLGIGPISAQTSFELGPRCLVQASASSCSEGPAVSTCVMTLGWGATVWMYYQCQNMP